MKNILIRLLSFISACFFYFTASAQKEDSIYQNKKTRDSIFRLTQQGHYVPDSFYNEDAVRKLKSGRLYKQQDSLYFLQKKLFDSAHKKNLFSKKIQDSVKRKITARNVYSDSIYRKKLVLAKLPDSLQRLYKLRLKASDSLIKLHSLHVKSDSLLRLKILRSIKTDSIKRKVYSQNIKADSQRIKNYLRFKKVQLQRFYEDTAAVKNGYRSRKLSMEISCFDGDTVYINNNYKKVIVKVIPSQKMRLYTTIHYREALNERDHEIFKKMGIQVSRTQSSVTATVNGTRQPVLRYSNDPCTDMINMESNNKRFLFIELPGNAIIVVNTNYAQTNIENFITSLKAVITNGGLTMGSAGNAVIKSNYSTINAGDIKTADLDLSYTNFTASNIMVMSIVSSSSIMKLDNCNNMKMASTSDEYNVDKAGRINGSKDFGKLNIENLKEELVMAGANADVKITSLSPGSPSIKIDSKYADVKLPLYDQKNYTVYYEGSYNDVNKLSSSTQKLNGTGTITANLSVLKDTLATLGKTPNINKTKFEANAGNITGSHTKVDIVCPFCNVVFN